jgi:hypothetical protein
MVNEAKGTKAIRKAFTYILLLSLDTYKICRTAMAPPELTGDTPVLDIL